MEVKLLEPHKGDDEHQPFVAVYKPVRGWCAIMLEYDEEMDMYVPWQTGIGSYKTRKEALRDAKAWAEDEGVAFKG